MYDCSMMCILSFIVLQFTNVNQLTELKLAAESIIGNIQNHLRSESKTFPKWLGDYLDRIGNPLENSLFQQLQCQISTVDDLKLSFRLLSLPHTLAYFKQLRDIVLNHLSSISTVSSVEGANVLSDRGVDVVTNSSGSNSTVDTLLLQYLGCIVGGSSGILLHIYTRVICCSNLCFVYCRRDY